jgi:hypothetical protein
MAITRTVPFSFVSEYFAFFIISGLTFFIAVCVFYSFVFRRLGLLGCLSGNTLLYGGREEDFYNYRPLSLPKRPIVLPFDKLRDRLSQLRGGKIPNTTSSWSGLTGPSRSRSGGWEKGLFLSAGANSGSSGQAGG